MRTTLPRPPSSRILVVGDCMLDRYVWGDASRLSPEAPVVVLRADEVEDRPGGAASVAFLLRGLGLPLEVSLCGAVADDNPGRQLRRTLVANGVDVSLLLQEDGRPTTLKERFIGRAEGRHAHQMLRVDFEIQDDLAPELAEQLLQSVAAGIDAFDVVLVSDYAKGLCTEAVVQGIIAISRGRGIPVLVDPGRRSDFRRYAGATLLKPNRRETELFAGVPHRHLGGYVMVGERLRDELHLVHVILTLDKDGMLLCSADAPWRHFPALERPVYDITGAGDMALAVLGACTAANLTIDQAVEAANAASGLEVERQGVAPVHWSEIEAELRSAAKSTFPKILTRTELSDAVSDYRARQKLIAFTNGCFDLLHAGHVRCVQDAAAQADVLIVGINGDKSARRLKGPNRPVVPVEQRAAMLAALECVAHVVVFDDEEPLDLLHQIRPDVLVKGGDYTVDRVIGASFVKSYGGRVHVAGLVPGVSTTALVAQVSGRTVPSLPTDCDGVFQR